MVDRTPQIARFAAHLHEHLIKMPAPMTKAVHSRSALPPDVVCEHWPKPVPPETHRLIGNIVSVLSE